MAAVLGTAVGKGLGHHWMLGSGAFSEGFRGWSCSGVAVKHPDVSSECGAHGLFVVKTNPTACHHSPQEELFPPSLPYSSSDKVSPASCPFFP